MKDILIKAKNLGEYILVSSFAIAMIYVILVGLQAMVK